MNLDKLIPIKFSLRPTLSLNSPLPSFLCYVRAPCDSYAGGKKSINSAVGFTSKKKATGKAEDPARSSHNAVLNAASRERIRIHRRVRVIDKGSYK